MAKYWIEDPAAFATLKYTEEKVIVHYEVRRNHIQFSKSLSWK